MIKYFSDLYLPFLKTSPHPQNLQLVNNMVLIVFCFFKYFLIQLIHVYIDFPSS